ncbi:bifunctional diguanylate cyclase/phosphodiesterase [Aliarcobacter vitoriensis]|uniref:Diguanylate cyclase n=1 Tax=Aliarcobacter vitoriensis TaxID=2011099 RepID=A0A366MR22_9BACT|nr:EAL domain-containing protein [Aliarcobacter vitoriensis]RBQ28283.1 diguanylate cyclase [Aliarcobacter vitoriensis]
MGEIIDNKTLLNEIEEILDKFTLLNQYKKALDESSIVSKTNKNGVITYVNDNFCTVSGYSKEELIGKNHNIIRHQDMPIEVFKELWTTILDKKVFKAIIKNRKKDGQSYYVDTTVFPIFDDKDNIIEFMAIRYDITKIYEQEKIIQEQYLDELTNLPNRQKLLKDIKKSEFSKVAVININRFRDINNFYGFETGDKVLQKFADILKKLTPSNLILYKLSNDIFAILSNDKNSLDDLKYLCKNIIENIAQKPILVANNSFYINVAIGVACNCLDNSSNLLSKAEFAVRIARKKDISILFLDENIELYNKLQENRTLVEQLKSVLENNNLLLYGQKMINNFTGEEKYETLMRLKLNDNTILSPFKFLEEAKKSKLYLNMTRMLVKKACEYFKDKNIHFSINLTLEDLKDTYTMDFIYNTLLRTKTAEFIAFEIVESEGIENFEEVGNFIRKVKHLGCKVAIDDFGTGYSNFEYIIKLDVDYVKIDGSLIKNIHKDEHLYLTVKTIVDFAKALNIKTVAEFVHNKEVFDIVQELKIDYSQGYYLHEPEELK